MVLQIKNKDIIPAIIGKIGNAGGTGYVLEYCGEGFVRQWKQNDSLQYEIEAGARAGMVAPDEKPSNTANPPTP